MIKDARSVVIKKRTFQEHIVFEVKNYADDGLNHRQDCLFVKSILPLRMSVAEAARQGITTLKPDLVFCLVRPRHSPIDKPILNIKTKALIDVASEIEYSFFSIDNKDLEKY